MLIYIYEVIQIVRSFKFINFRPLSQIWSKLIQRYYMVHPERHEAEQYGIEACAHASKSWRVLSQLDN